MIDVILAISTALYCAAADRIRGGFPSTTIWKPKNKALRRIFLTSIWFFSGFVLSAHLLPIQSINDILVCAVTSILFALGERQNMGVIGWIYPESAKQLAGWLQQFRIGAVWTVLISPSYFLNSDLWVLIPACFFGPVIGALLGRFLSFKLEPDWLFELNGQWSWTEFYRGLSIATIAIILN